MKKSLKYGCCIISVFMFCLMMSVTFAASPRCSITGAGHKYAAATCTSPKKCKCGATSGSKLGHNMTRSGTTTTIRKTSAICKTRIETSKCTRCSYKSSSSSNDTTHNYSSSVTKVATCAAQGNRKYTCKDCKYSYNESIAKTSHSYTMKSNASSHYEECSKCKSTRNKASHTYTYTVTKAATCTAVGSKIGTCSKCKYKITQTIAKIAHKPRGWQQGPQGGDTHYKVCNNCSQEISGSRAKHTYGSDGKCTACGIKKQGCMHKKQTVATCTSAGICSDCKIVLKAAKGHSYKVKYDDTNHWEKCDNCSSIKNKATHDLRYSDAKNGKHSVSCQKCRYSTSKAHSYTSQITTNPTCVRVGVETKTCSKCGAKTTSEVAKVAHSYNVEWNDKEHWEKCTVCGNVKNKGSHDLRGKDLKNGKHSASCQKCRYSVSSQNHNLIEEITEATCTKTGSKLEKCKICDYKLTTEINKIAHRPRGWQQGPQGGTYHYKVCNICSQEIEGTREDHKYDVNGKCTVCNILKEGCMHKRQKIGGCASDTICLDCGKVLKKAIAHDYKVEFDETNHWEKCSNCLNIKNKGTHDLRGIDLGIGKHSLSCQKCRYTGKNAHIFNANNICTICGCEKLFDDMTLINEQYSPTSEDDNKALQAKLKELGYYTSSIDGKMGPGTRRAINQMLEYAGVNRRLGENATWADIDTYLYTFIITNKETKSQAEARRKEEIKKEWANYLDVDTSLWTAEEEARFDAVVLAILNSDTCYDMYDLRGGGPKKVMEALENGDVESLTIDGVAYFDCSTFVSTILKVTYGFDYIRDDGGIYSTYSFANDKTNFTHSKDYAGTVLDVGSLQKGQLILCIDDDGVDHIMMYCGNGMIVHSNNTNKGVTMDKLSADDDYTDMFVSTDAGKYEHIYVLTPNK